MQSRFIRLLLVGVVIILIIAIVAATLTEVTVTGTPGEAGPEGPAGFNMSEQIHSIEDSMLVIRFQSEILFFLLIVVIAATLIHSWFNPVRVSGLFLLVFAAIALLLLILQTVSSTFPELDLPGLSPPNGTGPGAGQGPGAIDRISTLNPPETAALIGVIVLGFVFIGVVLSIYPESTFTMTADEPPDDDQAITQIGKAAGRAADRIEADADVDNEVYRAWQEMTQYLDVSRPATSTPGEFARAAIAAGCDEAAVEQLTDVFEEVRYGGADPTADRERRAIDALRHIEAVAEDA